MAEVDIIALLGVPLTPAGVVALLVQASVVSLTILLADYLVAHNMEIKHAVMMSVAAYFVTPLAAAGIAIAGLELPSLVAVYIVPLVVWVALGEVLLQGGDLMTKLKVAGVAFVVYLVLRQVGVVGIIAQLLPI